MAQRFLRTEDVFAAPLEDTTLLLNSETGCYHGLNPVAARIWELLAAPIDADALVNQLVTEFAVAPNQCAGEVVAFLAELRARGLIVES